MTEVKVVPGRLTQARHVFGVSTQSLAWLMRTKEETVSDWEAGRAMPTGDDVFRLSRIFGLPKGFWYKPLVRHFDPNRIHFHYRQEP